MAETGMAVREGILYCVSGKHQLVLVSSCSTHTHTHRMDGSCWARMHKQQQVVDNDCHDHHICLPACVRMCVSGEIIACKFIDRRRRRYTNTTADTRLLKSYSRFFICYCQGVSIDTAEMQLFCNLLSVPVPHDGCLFLFTRERSCTRQEKEKHDVCIHTRNK